jgi:hypothetical protein
MGDIVLRHLQWTTTPPPGLDLEAMHGDVRQLALLTAFDAALADSENLSVRVFELPCPTEDLGVVHAGPAGHWHVGVAVRQLQRASQSRLDECAAAMSTDGSPTKVLLTFAVPTDEVIFCVFVASSAEAVGEACARAGLPAQRVTAAVAAPFA